MVVAFDLVPKPRNKPLEEKRARSSAQQRIQDQVYPQLAPESTVGRRLPIGAEATIKSVTPDDFRDYYKHWYVPSNMTVIVVGDTDPAMVVDVITRHFGAGATVPTPTPRDVGVITPYAAQVRLLRERLAAPGLEIDSVDGFQGREKEAIVLSLVRSNTENDVGFLADVRRTNVALTRARRKLLVVGDSATLAALPFYRRLVEYFERVGAYHTVWEEPEV